MRPDSSIHWSAYPSLLLACAFAAGIGLGRLAGVGMMPLWLVGVGLGGIGFAAAQWWAQRGLVTLGPLGRVLAIAVLVVCAGGARHVAYRTPAPRALEPVAATSGDAVTLQGVVADAPEHAPNETQFTLEVGRVLAHRDTASLSGRARVTLQPSPWADHAVTFPDVQEGDSVRLRGSLRPAPGQRNPGGFDYGAYLARRGICCTMYIGDPSDVSVRAESKSTLTGGIVAVRQYLRTQIQRYVPSEGGRAVLQALLLGDRGRITEAQREDFARTGLMHLLAVSGLHVFLVGMVFYVLLRPLLMRFQLPWRGMEVGRALLTIALLGGYMVLTGGRPSVVRAVIMASLLIGSVVLQRSTHPLNTLGVAALVLLAVRPPALFDVGFQLSMTAVAGIVTLQPRLSAPVPEEWRTSVVVDQGMSLLIASVAAVLGTAPVLLFHFGWVSVGGLILNVAGIPCTAVALSAALAMALMGGVSTMAGAAFGSAADLFVQGLLLTSRQGADWLGWAGIRVANPSPFVLGALVLSVVGVAQWPRPRIRWRCIVGGLLLATLSVWGTVLGQTTSLDLIFFDVGNGDATLVSTPRDRHVLIDTGPRSPGGSAAGYSILPYLRQQGIQQLDAVIVTHPDEDHLGGLPAILREVSVEKVYSSGQTVDTELFQESRRLMKALDVPLRSVSRGDRISVAPNVGIRVLGPSRETNFESVNNASVVVRLAYGGVTMLFPGDIEKQAEQELVSAYKDQLESDLVNVPHHGSRTSSTQRFVEATSDSISTHAVVSVGRSNPYGMPHEEVVRRWQERARMIHKTSTQGAVWMRTDGERMWRVQWKESIPSSDP